MEPTNEACSSEERKAVHYLREIARFPPLSVASAGALVLNLPEPEAEVALIEGSLYNVVQIARQYQGQGVPLMDLIGEGNLCLVQAVQTFHTQYSTQFHRFIERALHRTMKQAICANASHDPLVSLFPFDATSQGVASVQCSSLSVFAHRNPEDALVAQEAYSSILSILGRLSPRQRQMLAHYYGFTGPVHGSFAAIGRELGISSSAVRAYVVAGMQKLRWARRELRELVNDIHYSLS